MHSFQIDRRRSCMYGCMSDARARLHFLGILFRRADRRFERQLRETNRGGSSALQDPLARAVSGRADCDRSRPALTSTAEQETAMATIQHPTAAEHEQALAENVYRLVRAVESGSGLVRARPEVLAALAGVARGLAELVELVDETAPVADADGQGQPAHAQ